MQHLFMYSCLSQWSPVLEPAELPLASWVPGPTVTVQGAPLKVVGRPADPRAGENLYTGPGARLEVAVQPWEKTMRKGLLAGSSTRDSMPTRARGFSARLKERAGYLTSR